MNQNIDRAAGGEKEPGFMNFVREQCKSGVGVARQGVDTLAVWSDFMRLQDMLIARGNVKRHFEADPNMEAVREEKGSIYVTFKMPVDGIKNLEVHLTKDRG